MVHPSITPECPELKSIATPILVVGGDGFLGSHVVQYLLHALPSTIPIHVLDIAQRSAPHERIIFHPGSLLDRDFVHQTLADNHIRTVIHTASPPHGKPRSFMYAVNVNGTKTLIQACLSANVTRFVFTSSSSVVFNGNDLHNVTEDALYCQVPMDVYTETKAIAEDMVLKANNLPTASGAPLLTIALRPSAIYGPRDGQQLPRLVDNILAGKSHMAIGTGLNYADFTYVENIAYAHVLAAAKLNQCVQLTKSNGEMGPIVGEAFFITDGCPIPFWDLNKCLHRHLLPAHDKRVSRASSVMIPRWIMMTVAYVIVTIMHIVSWLGIQWDPVLLPSRVILATATRTFDITKARTRLGYRPLFTMEEAMVHCVEWIKSVDRWRPLWQSSTTTVVAESNHITPENDILERTDKHKLTAVEKSPMMTLQPDEEKDVMAPASG